VGAARGVFIGKWGTYQGIRYTWRESNKQLFFTVPGAAPRRRGAFSKYVVCVVLVAVGEGGKLNP
jgi:hypothetical protein